MLYFIIKQTKKLVLFPMFKDDSRSRAHRSILTVLIQLQKKKIEIQFFLQAMEKYFTIQAFDQELFGN